MEKRAAFNEVAELYDAIRNRYPAQLFDDMFDLAQLAPGAHTLEIGPGTGIATLELAKRGCKITAVELGPDMAVVARRNLAPYPDVDIQVSSFEDWIPPTEPFDLVLAATAFHWVDPEVRYRKTASVLRSGGYLAIVSYQHVAGGDRQFFDEVQEYYESYMPGTPPNLRLPQAEDIVPDIDDLVNCGFYEHPVIRRYITEETYTSAQYIDLLSTYSNHRVLDSVNRKLLFESIGSLIDRQFGGKVKKCYLNQLILARRCRD